jgi:hypothetical protein
MTLITCLFVRIGNIEKISCLQEGLLKCTKHVRMVNIEKKLVFARGTSIMY